MAGLFSTPWRREEEMRQNDLRIMRGNIERDPVGQRLTPEAKERATEFAVNNWPANVGNGQAAQIGIKHVTSGILKD